MDQPVGDVLPSFLGFLDGMDDGRYFHKIGSRASYDGDFHDTLIIDANLQILFNFAIF